MQVFRHIAPQTDAHALAIGNFDGMHLGHQGLLKQLVNQALMQNLVPAVMTFEPHPREYFSPQNAPARLSSLREKLEYLKEVGVQKVFICRFNQAFSAISAQDFMQQILRQSLNTKAILVGDDFRFGAKRQGSVQDFIESGFQLIPFQQVQVEGMRVSSTLVREALAQGNLSQAQQYLGRPYSISGKVVHGAKRGRQLGFPTANVHMRHERPALTGVYAVKLDGLQSVANLGVRPTIEGIPKLMLEVHALNFDGNLYDKHVHVEFLQKIRDEMKFESLDALKVQIAKDVVVAKDYFKKTM